MSAENHSLDLRVVVGKEIKEAIEARPFVRDRAVVMLRSVLEVFGASGRWVHMMTGFGTLPNPSQYWIEIGAGSEMMPELVHVSIRSSFVAQGTIMGMLRLPSEIRRSNFLEAVGPIIRQFNSHGWESIVEREQRESMRPGSSGITTGSINSPKVIIDSDDEPVRVVRPTLIDGQTALALAQGGAVRSGRGRMYQVNPSRQRPERERLPSIQSRVQPRIGAELAARANSTFWIGARSTAVTLSIPSEKKEIAMGQSIATGHSVVFTRGEDCTPGTIKRAQAMLEYLLGQARFLEGVYDFCVTGQDEPARAGAGGPCVAFLLGGKQSGLQVRIRSRGGADGCISGLLSLPEGMDTESSFRIVAPLAANLNSGGWREVLDNISPEPPPPHGNAAKAPAAPMVEEVKFVALITRLLEERAQPDGCFGLLQLREVASSIFPDKDNRWYATGLLMKLVGQKLIQRVGKGEFQVTAVFLERHPVSRITLVPRPNIGMGRGSKTAKSAGDKSSKQKKGQKQQMPRVEPSDLLRVVQCIHEERIALVNQLDRAQRERASLESRFRTELGVKDAEIGALETALRAFDAKWRDGLLAIQGGAAVATALLEGPQTGS